MMHNSIPKALWPEFQIDNSWAIPEKQENKTLHYHCYCHECGFNYVKTLGYFQSKIITNPKIKCINCNNASFTYNIDSFEKIINIKFVLIKNKNSFTFISYMNKPFLKDGDVFNNRYILFKYKHYFSCVVKNKNAYLNDKFLTYLINKNLLNRFLESVYSRIRNELDSLYILPKKISEYKILEEHPMMIFSILNSKEKVSDFRFHFVVTHKFFYEFDDYIKYISNYATAKSIKKEFYKNSTYEITPDFFNLAYIICHSFTDINIISFLLKNTDSIYLPCNFDGKQLVCVIKIFLQGFSEKNFKKILFDENCNDIFGMMLTLGLDYNYDFSKVKCNIDSIHSKLIEIEQQEEAKKYTNTNFYYSENLRLKESQIEHLYFKLPENSLTLFAWGNLLHNCLFSYTERIIRNECTIYGVFKKNKLIYAVSINNSKILEASGKYNQSINEDDLKTIDNWFKYDSSSTNKLLVLNEGI